jgi:dTMP kinase
MTETGRRGLVLAYEGLDGAGKSTQIRMLTEKLQALGHRVEPLRLNANPLFKNQCRRLNEHDLIGPVEAALMKASELSGRIEMLQQRLAESTIVIWDKYVVGSVVSDVARGVAPVYTDAIVASLPAADLTIYLDITPAQALARKRASGGPRVMESGLDVAFGSARQAHEKMAAGEIDAADLDRLFLEFQTRMVEGYRRYLPVDGLFRLDGQQPPETLAGMTFDRVRELQLALVHNTASLEAQPSLNRSMR